MVINLEKITRCYHIPRYYPHSWIQVHSSKIFKHNGRFWKECLNKVLLRKTEDERIYRIQKFDGNNILNCYKMLVSF